MYRIISTFICVFILLLGFSVATLAQSTNASIIGIVIDDEGAPLPGASIRVENVSTGFKTGTSANQNGEFFLRQLPLGGPYTITATFIGFGGKERKGYTLDQSDQISIKFILSQESQELEEIVVSANDLTQQVEKMGATTQISSQQIENLPSEGRNFTTLTSLSPLQGGGTFNLAGQRSTSTDITVDGVNAKNQLTNGEIGRGPYTVSQEAIREFNVTTNDYDVTAGRQGGGAVKAVTKSGTNSYTGSIFFYHRADELQSDVDIRGNPRDESFYNSQYGLSIGGPIIKDKLHFFGVYDRQDAGEPLFLADINGQADEQRLRISQESLDRFLGIARNQYGVSSDQQFGQFGRTTKANNVFLRLDWQINDTHRLTARNIFSNWDNPFSVDDNSDIELFETQSNFESQQNSLLLSLRSGFSSTLTNEFKVQYQHAERVFGPNSLLPSSNIPRAIVEVTSMIDGQPQSRDVQFGGQRFSPETNMENQLQVTNTTYFQAGNYNFTFGTDNQYTFLETLLSNEQNGRFFFDSLEDFEALNPSRYAREVPLKGVPIVKQGVLDLTLFGQVEFNPHPDVNLTTGLRWDGKIFLDAAEFNPIVFDDLGIRTDEKPQDLNNFQPRFQAIWNIGGRDRDFLKLGGGLFSTQPHYYAQVNNIQNSGTLLGSIDLIGDDVPTPDFESYRADPSTAPGEELFDQLGITPFSTINAVSKDFEVPTVYKANLNYTHFFGDRYTLGVNLLISHTKNNYTYQETNLVNEPYFVTPLGREVFVPANTISEGGQVDWTESRISDRIGRTLLLTSDGVLDQAAIIFDGSARIGRDGYINASYTINETKDNSSYNCCVANTSTFLPVEGDPRDLNRGYSDNHFGSKIVVNTATPVFYGFRLGATLTGIGGTRYTLHVDDNTSANGDFNLRNDVAYIFDPNDPDTPTDIAQAYNDILNDPEIAGSFKDYLRDSFGGFAERNGGVNPFSAFIDLRATYQLNLPGVNFGNLEFSADIFNFANLLNDDWGNSNDLSSRRDFMRIQGFDQATQSYNYSVETGAGNEQINGTPWRLQLGVRYTF